MCSIHYIKLVSYANTLYAIVLSKNLHVLDPRGQAADYCIGGVARRFFAG